MEPSLPAEYPRRIFFTALEQLIVIPQLVEELHRRSEEQTRAPPETPDT